MDEGPGRREPQPKRPKVREHELLLGRLAEDAHVRCAAVAHEIARAGRVAAVLGALRVALLGLLDLARDGGDHHVASQRRIAERTHRGEIRHERTLHVRDPEPVDATLALEPLWLEARDPGQPRLAARVRRIQVPVEHQRRPAARAGPGRENVRAAVLHLLPLHRETELLALPGHPGGHRLFGAREARDRHGRQRIGDQALAVDHRSGPSHPGQPVNREEGTPSSGVRPFARTGNRRPDPPRARSRVRAAQRPQSSTNSPRCRPARAPAPVCATCGFEKPEASSTRHSSTDRGTCTDPGMIPSRSRSSCERRSTRTEPLAARASASVGS